MKAKKDFLMAAILFGVGAVLFGYEVLPDMIDIAIGFGGIYFLLMTIANN